MSKKEEVEFQKDSIVSSEGVHRVTEADVEFLEILGNEYTHALFRNVNYKKTINTCFLPVCLKNEDGYVAYMCLHDHPNLPAIPPWDWTSWIKNIYHLEATNPYNTLWLHLMGWNNQYIYTFLTPMFEYIFGHYPFLEFIILIIPPRSPSMNWLQGNGTRITPTGFYDSSKVQTLFLFVRQYFVNKYKIRRAVEEDNDNLVSLISTYSDKLEKAYGEFYIAEMITKHENAGRQLIVAEHNESAVAVLCLNKNINSALLNQEFELVPFYGLRQPHFADETYTISHLVSLHAFRNDTLKDEQSISNIVPSSYTSLSNIIPNEDDSNIIYEDESSEDDVVILNVSSVHLDIHEPSQASSIFSKDSADYSAIALSSNDYKMHLFTKVTTPDEDEEDDDDYHIPETNPYLDQHSRPTYHGKINAFALEIAASESMHELESIPLLLQAAFECFPNRNYCVLSLPSPCPPFPMLNLFVRVPPRPISTYPHELYILHRNAILGTPLVRAAVVQDIEEVQELLENMSLIHTFMDNFLSAVCEEHDFEAYAFTSEKKIVGVAVVRQASGLDYIKHHYDVLQWVHEEHYRNDRHGLLMHLVLSPIFQRQSKFFLKEIMRLSDYSNLYYCITPADADINLRERPICGIIESLVPVQPRRMPEFTDSGLDDETKPGYDVVTTDVPSYALYLATKAICTLKHHEINIKIVVVGTSSIALSFLNALIHSKARSYRVTFSNITVISPHGINSLKKDNHIRNLLFVSRTLFDCKRMQMISLQTYVNEVFGVMTSINRKNKTVVVNDKFSVPYDFLFIMCGKQFQKAGIGAKKTKCRFPDNVFLINTDLDARNALRQIKRIGISEQGNVIVYGYELEAFCCVNALISFGVPRTSLTFVESFPIRSKEEPFPNETIFNDPEVDGGVRKAIEDEGVTYHRSYYFVDWTMDKDENLVTSVKFESTLKRLNLDCKAMFMYHDKQVSEKTFKAINSAGLVFDGALVIGPDCKTNDPFIYGAGTITKYSRRYYADDLAHKYFNFEEIGTKLAHRIRAKIIPNCEEDDSDDTFCKPGNMIVPHYKEPVVTFCQLPGGLQYLLVAKPGKPVPLEVAMTSEEYGNALVTGSCKKLNRQGYFRIHLNRHGVVETITCLTKCKIDVKNIISLWGKHEKLLNNLKTRFETIFVPDLYSYFREPWAYALYHDRYTMFDNSIYQLIQTPTEIEGSSPLEDLVNLFKDNDWKKIKTADFEKIQEKLKNSKFQKVIEERLLEFVIENKSFLPMYACPDFIRRLLISIETSPLFHPQ